MDVLAVSGFCHGGASVFLLVLALCCRSTCQFRGNSEKSNHMLSATSHIGLEFLTKFLNMSNLQNRLILLYQSLPLQTVNWILLARGPTTNFCGSMANIKARTLLTDITLANSASVITNFARKTSGEQPNRGKISLLQVKTPPWHRQLLHLALAQCRMPASIK